MAELEPGAISMSTRGSVAQDAADYAREKVAAVASVVSEPVIYAEIELIEDGPARDRPAEAEATLDVNGQPVRAHVAGVNMFQAVDLLVDVLTRRLRRYQERKHREGRERYQTGEATDGEWRRGNLPTDRPQFFDRAYDERELVRTKSFGAIPTMIDEAVLDLELLGHDFHLFNEASTGMDAVVFYKGGGTSLGLQRMPDAGDELSEPSAAEVEVVAPAPTLTRDEAIERLEASKERFVFFVDESTGRGAVIYHRYDGHWGLITTHD